MLAAILIGFSLAAQPMPLLPDTGMPPPARDAAMMLLAGGLMCDEVGQHDLLVEARGTVADMLDATGLSAEQKIVTEDDMEQFLIAQQGNRHVANLIGQNGITRANVLKACRQNFDDARHKARAALARMRR